MPAAPTKPLAGSGTASSTPQSITVSSVRTTTWFQIRNTGTTNPLQIAWDISNQAFSTTVPAGEALPLATNVQSFAVQSSAGTTFEWIALVDQA